MVWRSFTPGGLLEKLWNYWMSCCSSVLSVPSTTGPSGWVWNGSMMVVGCWCVGMLLGPEATPVLVGVSLVRGLFWSIPPVFCWLVGGCGGSIEWVVWLVFENCIVDASILFFGVLDNLTVCCVLCLWWLSC